ncbi:hypothetical protein JCM11491_003665 [Sporobolomyces phaffii]
MNPDNAQSPHRTVPRAPLDCPRWIWVSIASSNTGRAGTDRRDSVPTALPAVTSLASRSPSSPVSSREPPSSSALVPSSTNHPPQRAHMPLRRPPFSRSGTSSGVDSSVHRDGRGAGELRSGFSEWGTSHASSSNSLVLTDDSTRARAQTARDVLAAGPSASAPALLLGEPPREDSGASSPPEPAPCSPSPSPARSRPPLRRAPSAPHVTLVAAATTEATETPGSELEPCHRPRRRRGSVPGRARPLHSQFTSANVESLVSEYGYSDRLATFIVETLCLRGPGQGD